MQLLLASACLSPEQDILNIAGPPLQLRVILVRTRVLSLAIYLEYFDEWLLFILVYLL